MAVPAMESPQKELVNLSSMKLMLMHRPLLLYQQHCLSLLKGKFHLMMLQIWQLLIHQ